MFQEDIELLEITLEVQLLHFSQWLLVAWTDISHNEHHLQMQYIYILLQDIYLAQAKQEFENIKESWITYTISN